MSVGGPAPAEAPGDAGSLPCPRFQLGLAIGSLLGLPLLHRRPCLHCPTGSRALLLASLNQDGRHTGLRSCPGLLGPHIGKDPVSESCHLPRHRGSVSVYLFGGHNPAHKS